MQPAVLILTVVVAALFARWMPDGPLTTAAWWSTRLIIDVGLSIFLVVLCGIAAGGGLPRSPKEPVDDRAPLHRPRRLGLRALTARAEAPVIAPKESATSAASGGSERSDSFQPSTPDRPSRRDAAA